MRTLILVVVLASGVLAQSQSASSLDAARELYATADYRGALATLDRLAAADPTRPDRPAIDLYRAFCLIALERAGEARRGDRRDDHTRSTVSAGRCRGAATPAADVQRQASSRPARGYSVAI